MTRSYTILRINEETATVLLTIGNRTLQQDVDLADKDAMEQDIFNYMAKLENDLSTAGVVPQEITDLVGEVVPVTDADIQQASGE